MNSNATWTVPTYEPSLRDKLKHLLSHHTAAEVYGTLMEIYQEDYAFYRGLFNQAQAAPQPQPASQAPPHAQPVAQPSPPSLTKVRGDIRIRVVKRPEAEVEEVPDTIEKAIEIQTKAEPLNVDTLPDVSDQEEEEQKAPMNEKERKARIKKEQAQAERKKFEELKAQGIVPESLLTKENLNTWVNTQGLSFTQIAREYVGIDAEKISEVAKKFGLQSNIAKKRAILMAQKKK